MTMIGSYKHMWMLNNNSDSNDTAPHRPAGTGDKWSSTSSTITIQGATKLYTNRSVAQMFHTDQHRNLVGENRSLF
jgi:hypothetical protein